MLEKILTDFTFLWATIDPVSTLVIFTGLTAKFNPDSRKSIAFKAILYSTIVLIGALVLGQLILVGMGIRMLPLQVAGGIILFLFALKMIFQDFQSTSDDAPEKSHSIAVYPLAIPSIATPGAIMAVILLTDNHIYTLPQQAMTAAVLVVILGITYTMMLLSQKILRLIGQNGAAILVKVMGMLLAALSIELVMEAVGIEQWLGPKETF